MARAYTRSAPWLGRAGGALCDPAKYRRLYLYRPAYRDPLPERRLGVFEKRAAEFCARRGCRIRNAVDLAALAKDILRNEIEKREHVLFVLVDTDGKIRLIGSFSSKAVDLCKFKFSDMIPDLNAALMDTAAPGGLFIIHNHPSGGAAFSREDLEMTNALIAFHKDMPFGVVDSVVITKGGAHVSLRYEQDRFLHDDRYQTLLRELRFRDF